MDKHWKILQEGIKDEKWFDDLTGKRQIMLHSLRNYKIRKEEYKASVALGMAQFVQVINDTAAWRCKNTPHASGFQISSALEHFNNFSGVTTELTSEVKKSLRSFANNVPPARKIGTASLLRRLREIYSPVTATAEVARAPEPFRPAAARDPQPRDGLEYLRFEVELLQIQLEQAKGSLESYRTLMEKVFKTTQFMNTIKELHNTDINNWMHYVRKATKVMFEDTRDPEFGDLIDPEGQNNSDQDSGNPDNVEDENFR
jgi:hypothetical protein